MPVIQSLFGRVPRAPLTGRPMLVNFNEGAGAIGETSGVSAERQLTVGEIISRHQQQQLAQDRLVRNYIADARMRQYFRPTETDPGYDIVHREPLLRRRRRRRVGRAVVRGQRTQVDGQSAAVADAAAGEGALAAAPATIRRRVPLPIAGHRARGRLRLLRGALRAGSRRSIALSRNGLDRSADVRAQSACTVSREICRAWSSPTRRRCATRPVADDRQPAGFPSSQHERQSEHADRRTDQQARQER